MKRAVRILVMMLAIAATAGVSAAYAQGALSVDVPFAFKVGANDLPAGKYEVRPSEDQAAILIAPAKGKETPVLVITRLAESEPALSEGRLVFDKVGELSYLSEIWFPGSDGYLVHSTKGKHTHVKVKLSKKS